MSAPANTGAASANAEKRGHLCAACGGVARGLHWRNPDRDGAATTLHLCDRAECRSLAWNIDHMTEAELTAIEKNAAVEAIPALSDYLLSIGKTDLSELTHDEAEGMMTAAINGYRHAVLTGIKDAPPF